LLARIEAAPGVDRVAGAAFLPMRTGIGTGFYRADRPVPSPAERVSADVRPVTPGFFRTMGIPIMSGRDFTAADIPGTKMVAVISESVARLMFGGENPIGEKLGGRAGGDGQSEVIGGVSDIRMSSLVGDVSSAACVAHAKL